MTLHVLLSGIVGSTAYGLAGKDSDVDTLGVYAAPTAQLLGLHRPKRSFVTKDPDVALFEIGRWCQLALAGNPTVMELLWLPVDLYKRLTPLGSELVSLRHSFLAGKQVRDAYLGYASQQFQRLQQRGTFGSDLRNRTRKHGRHLARLLYQGYMLYQTGQLTVRLPPEQIQLCRDLGDAVADGDLAPARHLLSIVEGEFNRTRTPLPDRPDSARVDRWLREARRQLWNVDIPDIETERSDQ